MIFKRPEDVFTASQHIINVRLDVDGKTVNLLGQSAKGAPTSAQELGRMGLTTSILRRKFAGYKPH